jgi:serine/threonine protein kinase
MQIISNFSIIIIINRDELFENIKHAQLDIPPYVSSAARDLIVKLLNRNPKKRLGSINGADEIKKHPFFKAIDWNKLYKRQYRPPEPYLKKRFENFLSLSPAFQTNADVYDQLKKQAALVGNKREESHVPGWSFISPNRKDQ